MQDIRIADNLWANSMAPEGVLERWRVAPGAPVAPGQAIAEVRIEDALHDILAPGCGRLIRLVDTGDIVEPGSLVARLDRTPA